MPDDTRIPTTRCTPTARRTPMFSEDRIIEARRRAALVSAAARAGRLDLDALPPMVRHLLTEDLIVLVEALRVDGPARRPVQQCRDTTVGACTAAPQRQPVAWLAPEAGWEPGS